MMVNPFFGRRVRGRRRRRNPSMMGNIRRAFSRKWLMNAVTIGGGLAGGFALKSLYKSFRPAGWSTSDNWAAGLVNIVVGSLLFAMRQRKIKEIGVIVAGTGLYDLVASNLPIGLPPIPAVGLVQQVTGRVAGSYASNMLPVSPTAAVMPMSASYADGAATVGLPGVSGTALTTDPYEGIFS